MKNHEEEEEEEEEEVKIRVNKCQTVVAIMDACLSVCWKEEK